MKPVILIAIAVGVAISVSVMWAILYSDLGVIKSDCDIHKDQIFKMGERFEKIRELQKGVSPGTNDYYSLDQEFEKLTIQALEKRNWYIANCLE